MAIATRKRPLRRTVSEGVLRVYRAYHMRRRVIGMQRHQTSNDVPVSHAEARRYWREHFRVNICTRWHQVYAQANGRDDPRFVPEDVFYSAIMPRLNDPQMELAYADKNLYCRWLPEEILPEAVLRCVHSRFYSRDFERIDPPGALSEGEDYFIKPSLESGAGVQVEILRFKAGQPHLWDVPTTWEKLRAEYRGNFIVQRRLQQHPEIAALNASSINTVRVMTLRLNDEPSVVGAVMRIGTFGAHVDNLTRGGAVSCGILPDGTLNSWACDEHLNRVLVHPQGGYVFGGQQIPGIDAAQEMVLGLHGRLRYFDLVAWDICIGQDSRPRLVEANLWKPGINLHQANTGPLFGDRTEEFLHYVRGLRPASRP
jgi:hypothetical protein